MSTHLARSERETVVAWTEGDENVRITSTSPGQITKLRADERFHEVQSTYTDGLTAELVIPVGQFTLTKAAKRRMSVEERERRGLSLFRAAIPDAI